MLTEKEAYMAMLSFLNSYWERNGQPGELGSLLGSMVMLEDGSPADPAMWGDWIDEISKVKLQ